MYYVCLNKDNEVVIHDDSDSITSPYLFIKSYSGYTEILNNNGTVCTDLSFDRSLHIVRRLLMKAKKELNNE